MDRSNASKPLHGWHYHHLLSRAAQVKLPHPIMLRAIGGSTNTNNRLQARKISHFLRCDFPPQARILPYRSRYPQQTAPASSDIRDRRLVPIAMDQAGATLRLTIEIGNGHTRVFSGTWKLWSTLRRNVYSRVPYSRGVRLTAFVLLAKSRSVAFSKTVWRENRAQLERLISTDLRIAISEDPAL